jgi:hypothetical protein
LDRRIGTDQFIWCYTVDRPERRGNVSKWILDMQAAAILRFVDEVVWSRIRGERCVLPLALTRKWEDEAIARLGHDANRCLRAVADSEEAFWSQAPPGGSWWTQLFVEPQAQETVSALVPHPVRPEWVVENPLQR